MLELLRIATGKVLQYRNHSKELLQWSLTHTESVELARPNERKSVDSSIRDWTYC